MQKSPRHFYLHEKTQNVFEEDEEGRRGKEGNEKEEEEQEGRRGRGSGRRLYSLRHGGASQSLPDHEPS